MVVKGADMPKELRIAISLAIRWTASACLLTYLLTHGAEPF
jgi:hypothetical protein